MQRLAYRIVNAYGAASRDDRAEIGAVFDFIKNNVPYRGDTRYFDTYRACYHSLDFEGNGVVAGGECDDHATCLNSLLWVLGYATGVKIISKDGEHFQHIYSVVGVPRGRPTKWKALDTTVDKATVGWEPPKSARKLERQFLFARDGVYELT
jgi:hypothetical protein